MTSSVLFIGSKPGEIEWKSGGLAVLFSHANASVHFVSVSDGSKSHFDRRYVQDPDALARRRYHEAKTSAERIGAEYELMGLPEGELFVNLANTEEMIRLLRNTGTEGKGPDLVVTSRLGAGDRDQRYCSQLVHDAFSMLQVASMCADTPYLERLPILAYWWDEYTQGGEFRPDMRIDVSSVMDMKCDMIAAHESLVFEWMPWLLGVLDTIPEDEEEREIWIRKFLLEDGEKQSRRNPEEPFNAQEAQYIETYQISEYGARVTPEEIRKLFGTD